MSSSLERFQELLRDLFQLDYADLDFGIYRLFRIKKDEVNTFIDDDLPRMVSDAFGAAADEEQEDLQQDFETLQAEIRDSIAEDAILPDGRFNPEYDSKVKVVRELKEQYEALQARLETLAVSEQQKIDVFNHLFAFFSRYYEDGDFMPKRRYGAHETYAVPYEGEELLFHWPARGMHYIKSGEHFRDYSFEVHSLQGPLRIRFALTEANLPRDNTKGDTRYFFPLSDQITYEAGTLTIPFHYRLPTQEEAKEYKKQRDLLDAHHEPLLRQIGQQVDFAAEALKAPQNDDGTTLLMKRLVHFTRRNTSDYFVFPELKAFLERELEFYLKDQVLHLDDIKGNFEGKRRLIQVIDRVARHIITFLDQIEQVQVRLFEKPKLVLSTDYLVPIRHVPPELWTDVLAEPKQVKAWQDLFGTPDAVDEAFLKAHPTLVVNTEHFDVAFKHRLLQALPFDDLDEATDGLLVHGENYQALNLLRHTYSSTVSTVYIDPPYNTGNDDFIYKDRYQHASWLAMMEERLQLAKEMLSNDGAIFISIDDDEQARLKNLCDRVFGAENFVAAVIWQKKYAPANDAKWLSDDHDYLLLYAKDKDQWHPDRLPRTEKQNKAYSNPDNDPRGPWRPDNYKSNKSSDERPNLFYCITNPNTGQEIWPSKKAVWRYTEEQHEKNEAEKRVWWGEDGTNSVPAYKRFLSEVGGLVPRTIWPWKEVGHNQDAVRELQALFVENPFSSPKPTKLIYRILQVASGSEVHDFLAGSGTTGDAVIRFNRENNERRRFVLTEMGQHFNTVLLPRIQKVMYAPAWKNGSPEDDPVFDDTLGDELLPKWVKYTPRLVKVLRLESYDDSIHNLAAAAENGRDARRAEAARALTNGQAYRLRYLFNLPMQETDTLLGTDELAHPHRYALEVLTDAGTPAVKVDLVETVNLLLGLRVKRYEKLTDDDGRDYLLVHARQGEDDVLAVWRDLDGLNPEQERTFLAPHVEGYRRILVNGDAALPGAVSIDALIQPLFSGRAAGQALAHA